MEDNPHDDLNKKKYDEKAQEKFTKIALNIVQNEYHFFQELFRVHTKPSLFTRWQPKAPSLKTEGALFISKILRRWLSLLRCPGIFQFLDDFIDRRFSAYLFIKFGPNFLDRQFGHFILVA